MRFNTNPANTLHAKVSLKTKPYSNEVVAFRVTADTYATFNSNNAQFYAEIPLQSATFMLVHQKVEEFQALANAKVNSTSIKPNAFNMLLENSESVA